MPVQVKDVQREIKARTMFRVGMPELRDVYGAGLKATDTLDVTTDEVMAKLRDKGHLPQPPSAEPDPADLPAEASTNGATAKKPATAKKAAAKKAAAKKPATAKKAAATKAPAAKKLPPTKPRDRDEPVVDRNEAPEEFRTAQRRRIAEGSPAAAATTAAKSGPAKRTAKAAPGRDATPALRTRQTRPVNELVREELMKIILADRALREGPPFRPTVEAHGAIQYKYVDPLDHLLDDTDVRFGRPNKIIIGQDQYDRDNANPKRNFRWRSKELLRKVERLLSQLWGEGVCPGCNRPITSGFKVDANDVLFERKHLPNTPGATPSKVVKPPTYHDACYFIRAEKRDLDIELQDHQADDPATVAYRAEYYVAMVTRVHARLLERDPDATIKEVAVALRDNLRVAKEAADRGK